VICFKGVEALPQDSTKLSFFILDRDFYEGKAKFFESYLRLALEDYFKENPVHEEPMCASYLLEEEWNVGFIRKELASRVGPAWTSEEVNKSLAEDSFLAWAKCESYSSNRCFGFRIAWPASILPSFHPF